MHHTQSTRTRYALRAVRASGNAYEYVYVIALVILIVCLLNNMF